MCNECSTQTGPLPLVLSIKSYTKHVSFNSDTILISSSIPSNALTYDLGEAGLSEAVKLRIFKTSDMFQIKHIN